MTVSDLGVLLELSQELSESEIGKISVNMALPPRITSRNLTGMQFINAMKCWEGFDRLKFDRALGAIGRHDLLPITEKLSVMNLVSTPGQPDPEDPQSLVRAFLDLLRNELTNENVYLIYMNFSKESAEHATFDKLIETLLEKGLIHTEMNELTDILVQIQRIDIVTKLQYYENIFIEMPEELFLARIKFVLESQSKEMVQWEYKLKQFSLLQHEKVEQMIGRDEAVYLASVYVDLTIVKQEPRPVNFEDETTYNEIAMLRKIAEQQFELITVDFTKELKSYQPTKPEIWCLIGNPGCGKTFLSKRIGLRFSCSELVNVLYSISIPCRNPDWHAMETTRYDKKEEIENEFISKWICLGLPKGPNWSKDLSKHLTECDGERLLLIIDGLDEFTQKVPFESTYLYLLLTRQSLTRSTIIVTSRPGAWTDISIHGLKIDRFYQVLGFSPQNRDLYFEKQIKNTHKLLECRNLLEKHDEINQLSLIPVIASLFAALLKGEDSTAINTLTKIYLQLILYLIRRQLIRMKLAEFSKVKEISSLHPDILECLHKIGFIAYLGVANRELASSENVPLYIGKEEYSSQCLGLAHEHYKYESVGIITKVWTFAHLTMQEFTATIWLTTTHWTNQCLSVRYISHTEETLSPFKMVLRFLCGIQQEESAALLTIMYKFQTHETTHVIGLPMIHQLLYDMDDTFIPHAGWYKFTERYFLLNAYLYETNSISIPNWFAHLRQYLPTPISFYIRGMAITPNEWSCFLQSLELVGKIQVIYTEGELLHVISLLEKLKFCSVGHLALRIGAAPNYDRVFAYTDLIRRIELPSGTKISLHLWSCELTQMPEVNLFSTAANRVVSSLGLISNAYSNRLLHQLANQLSILENFCLSEDETEVFQKPFFKNPRQHETNLSILFSALCQATQLKGICLYTIRDVHKQRLLAMLPHFSNLQEIRISNYSLLPQIMHLSTLTFLAIDDYSETDPILSSYLLSVIKQNRKTLKVLKLEYLHSIGFNVWRRLLNTIKLGQNIFELELISTFIVSCDVIHWCRTVQLLKSLVILRLYEVTLYDLGLRHLCLGLICHPAIIHLVVNGCGQTSQSCSHLTQLLPTLQHLKKLNVTDLSEPDNYPIELLKLTANECGIEISFEEDTR